MKSKLFLNYRYSNLSFYTPLLDGVDVEKFGKFSYSNWTKNLHLYQIVSFDCLKNEIKLLFKLQDGSEPYLINNPAIICFNSFKRKESMWL